ncbi:hypothetical protein [Pseudonocardia humida]|uniref:Membrane protein YmcC n=1 Tax=Pseudonocardia humida TaxID=2800819 RepID=A0ABT1ABJ7_9PSEU|nr:hypothetical protein [Pseudonocardia humida]MCO1660305.1 hypothetical protein [Pseudonocardia humida]
MSELLANPLVWLIAASEIGFWVLLAAGLLARYVLRLRRTSTVLLLLVPVLDLVLIGASLADVASGSPPGQVHGLAAVYLGGTVAFGHTLIRWADRSVAHRFAGGPPPPPKPKYGPEKVAYEWREWAKMAVLTGIAVAVMLLVSAVAGTEVPPVLQWGADPMWSWAFRVGIVTLIWFGVGPVWTTLAPPKAPERTDAQR